MLAAAASCAAVLLSSCGDSSLRTEAGARLAQRVLVSAHRGGAAYAPENTMLAFRNAVRLGVDQIEADTQLTADGELVLIHDDSLDRTTDCQGAVAAHSFAEVRACDAAFWFTPGQPTTLPDAQAPHPLRGSGVRVPGARELFAYLRDLGETAPELSIEIKDIPGESNFEAAGAEVAAVLVPLIQEYGLQRKTIVQSFWPPALEQVKRLDPSLRTQFLTTSRTGQTAAQNLAYVVALDHDILAPNYDAPDLNRELVDSAHAAGKQVIPYTVDRPADMEQVAALGVEGLISNFPACALLLQGRHDGRRVLPSRVPGALGACPAPIESPGVILGTRPDPAVCAALRPSRWQPAQGRAEQRPGLRVVALQYKHEVRHVESYASFRTKMRCLMEDHVVPVMSPRVPTLVVYNEDIGLMTLATGSRGQLVREQTMTPLGAPGGDQAPAPAGIAAALGTLSLAYAPQIAAYQARFGPMDPRKQVFIAATDTFARAFSQTFADIARDYGVYVVASNNQARYRASRDPADIAVFADPDLGAVEEVYVATSPRLTNQTVLWGPRDVHPDAPAGETNLLFRNDKVPITAIERDLIALDEGPAEGPDAIANAAGWRVAGFHLGFATSLPAFAWGYDFGQRPAALVPCADVRISYMPCMDALGVDVVVQAEANPGRWAMDQAGGWQPLEWMDSTWRTVADRSVGFRYNITAHLVGNLLDLVFDGQTAITARGARARARHYIGNAAFHDGVDPEAYRPYAGAKREFLRLAPWVTADASRAELRDTAARLAPGSGDVLENDYLETAVWADLTH